MNSSTHVSSAQRESRDRLQPSWPIGTFSGKSVHHGGIGGPQQHHWPSLLTGPPAGYRHYQAWVTHRLLFLIKYWLMITDQRAVRRPDGLRASVFDSVSETTSKDATQQKKKKYFFNNDLLPSFEFVSPGFAVSIQSWMPLSFACTPSSRSCPAPPCCSTWSCVSSFTGNCPTPRRPPSFG